MASRAVWAAVAAGAYLLPTRGAHRLRNAGVSAEGGFTYDYSHSGTDWAQGACSSRARQSPVNFDDLETPPSGKLAYMYDSITRSLEVINNGHTFTADMSGLGIGGITYMDAWYNLMNINVHAKSEHTFKSLHTPLELHIVHKKFDNDQLIIVAIPIVSNSMPPVPGPPPSPNFIQESVLTRNASRKMSLSTRRQGPVNPDAANAALEALAAYTPPHRMEENFNEALQLFLKVEPPQINLKTVEPISVNEPLDLNMLYRGGTFLEYAGSMTAPPCAEIATWFVRREPIIASDNQVQILHQAIYHTTAEYGNARDTMPLNGRAIAVRSPVQEVPPPEGPQPQIPAGPNPVTDRQFRALKWSNDALKIAKASQDYITDVDYRLRSAALAHASALDPGLIPELLPTPAPMPTNEADKSAWDFSKTAESMARVIANAAKEAIGEASKRIAIDAKAAAVRAAKEASKMVKQNLPQPQLVPSGAPAPAALASAASGI